jgi:hypothetical protein
MATKKVSKIADKLVSVSDSFTVNMYDNGFMLEISGKDSKDEWPSAKIVCNTIDELLELVKEAVAMPQNS